MLLDWILALVPLLLIVVLMVRFHWGAARAGPAGWLAGVTLAASRFGAGIGLLAVAQAKAVFLALDVLLIVWGAFLLYRVVDEAGAIRVLGQAIPHLTSDKGMQALLVGWAFASFLQGVGGFGVPVVVTAPILLGMGFPPLTAVVIPSIGHAWSVTFGSLASSFQALIAATGLPGQGLAPASALLLGLAGFGSGFMVAHVAEGWAGVRRLAAPVIVLGVIMGVTQHWLATHGLWNIAGFGAGMAGLTAGVFITRRYRGERNNKGNHPNGRTVVLALAGYLALVAITLLIQLTPSLRALLGWVVLQGHFPEVQTARGFVTLAQDGAKLILLRHAGAILSYTSLMAYLVYRRAGLYSPGAARRILVGTVRGVTSSSLGIAAMVSLAVVMSHTGMTDVLASGLAQAVGIFFPLASPWIGAIGAFISGSNTNANLLFGMLQLRTAELLGISAPLILAAQTTGGAVGSVVAPTKVVVGASSVGEAVEEGEVMRRLLKYTGVLIGCLSLVVLALAEVWRS